LIATGKARPGDTFLSVTIGSDTEPRPAPKEGVQVVVIGGQWLSHNPPVNRLNRFWPNGSVRSRTSVMVGSAQLTAVPPDVVARS
jgi:hypothetical protein